MDLAGRIERKKGAYDWSAYEELTANLEKRGLRALYILDYSNPLYEEVVATRNPSRPEQRDTASPQHPESVAAFARWAERRPSIPGASNSLGDLERAEHFFLETQAGGAVAETLQVDPERIEIVQGDSDVAQASAVWAAGRCTSAARRCRRRRRTPSTRRGSWRRRHSRRRPPTSSTPMAVSRSLAPTSASTSPHWPQQPERRIAVTTVQKSRRSVVAERLHVAKSKSSLKPAGADRALHEL